MAKHAVFVLDVSGSMRGKKMKQTKVAMQEILGQLSSKDTMTLVDFSDEARTWRAGEVAAATQENIHAAMKHVSGLDPRGEPVRREWGDHRILVDLSLWLALGGTNLGQALEAGLLSAAAVEGGRQPMIFFLTDGHATAGVTEDDAILALVANANAGNAPIFCLAFGRQADVDLLRLLAARSRGLTRRIYVAADAALQLEGFYREVSEM